LAAVFLGYRTPSSFQKYVCSFTPIFLLTAIGNGLASPHLNLKSRSKGDDLLGGFFLSAFRRGKKCILVLTRTESLREWCRYQGGMSKR
jgi:hypothetical protein